MSIGNLQEILKESCTKELQSFNDSLRERTLTALTLELKFPYQNVLRKVTETLTQALVEEFDQLLALRMEEIGRRMIAEVSAETKGLVPVPPETEGVTSSSRWRKS